MLDALSHWSLLSCSILAILSELNYGLELSWSKPLNNILNLYEDNPHALLLVQSFLQGNHTFTLLSQHEPPFKVVAEVCDIATVDFIETNLMALIKTIFF